MTVAVDEYGEALPVEDEDIFDEVTDREPQHPEVRLRTFEEHDQRWVECLRCGRQWGVHETESERGEPGLSLEKVSEGDGYCDENPAEDE